MNELKPTRQLLTSYYIAIIFGTFIFRLIPNQIVIWVTWFISFLNTSLGMRINTEGGVWICLFLVCFSIIWMIRKLIVQPLGFYVNGQASSAAELVLLFLFVFGFLIFSINRLFPEYTMPAGIPGPILKLLGASQASFFTSTEERNVWSIVPWLWYFGPIAVMYSMFINQKIHSSSGDDK